MASSGTCWSRSGSGPAPGRTRTWGRVGRGRTGAAARRSACPCRRWCGPTARGSTRSRPRAPSACAARRRVAPGPWCRRRVRSGPGTPVRSAAWRRARSCRGPRAQSAWCATRAPSDPPRPRAARPRSGPCGRRRRRSGGRRAPPRSPPRRAGRSRHPPRQRRGSGAGSGPGCRPRRRSRPRLPRRHGGRGAPGRSGRGRRCRDRDGRADLRPCRRHRRRVRMPRRRGQWPSASFRVGQNGTVTGTTLARRWSDQDTRPPS